MSPCGWCGGAVPGGVGEFCGPGCEQGFKAVFGDADPRGLLARENARLAELVAEIEATTVDPIDAALEARGW